MNNTQYIICYVDEITKYNFFKRLSCPLFELGYNIILITNRISLYIICKITGCKIKLINNTKNNYLHNKSNFKPSELLSGELTLEQSIKIYNSVYQKCNELFIKYKIEYGFIFNGTSAATMALSEFCKSKKVKKKYFELSNIPGKIFVDNEGTNANSSLMKNIDLLKEYYINEQEFIEWKNKYIDYKKNEKLIGQGKKNKNIYLGFIIDYYLSSLFNIPFYYNNSIFYKIHQKYLLNKSNPFIFDDLPEKNEKFVFYPLQVSNDSQLLLNSKFTNKQAIIKTIEMANSRNLKVVVKPHPAEPDIREIENIFKLKNKYDFKIVNSNTYEILSKAELIITINSTVGLEGLIFNKEVIFLGKTFFAKLNNILLRNYLLGYLINIEYYGSDKITKSETEKILK